MRIVERDFYGRDSHEVAPELLGKVLLCDGHGGRIVEGLKIAPSPSWLADRLTAAGVRPISSLVDVTNYVLLEHGHPLHAFDLERLRGQTIGVRRSRPGEKLVTLDGKERELTEGVLVITDGSGAVALGNRAQDAFSWQRDSLVGNGNILILFNRFRTDVESDLLVVFFDEEDRVREVSFREAVAR